MSEVESKLYPGINKVILGGVVQTSTVKDAKDADKCYNNFTLRVNEKSYNGKPYHLSIYCTYYGTDAGIRNGDFLLIDGSIKTADFGGEYKNIVDVKSIKKVFTDPAGVISSKRKDQPSKKQTSLDDLPPMPNQDEDIPF